jgi:hypothetical protein
MEGEAMSGKNLGLAFFFVGTFALHAYQTLSFLWYLVGVPLAYPLVALLEGLGTYAAGFAMGFSPLIGLLLMVLGGLIYGRETRTEVIE